MPANLPPQYFEAEKKLHSAKDPAAKIEVLEELLAIMPKHKGTDKLRAELRGRIAKLTQSMSKKAATHRSSMLIERVGAAQVAVAGLPNSGKSHLVASVTNAATVVADYPFATQNAIPGMMAYENIKIQLIDTPPLAPQPMEFWLPHMLRRTDALLVVLDMGDEPLGQIEAIITLLEKMKIAIIPESESEEVIISQKRALIAANKMDIEGAGARYQRLLQRYGNKLPIVAISAREKNGLDKLGLETFKMLNIIRVYTKTPGQRPDFSDPIILKKGSTLDDAAANVHKDFAASLKYARVWGSGKHDGLGVKRDHVLEDGDVVELHM